MNRGDRVELVATTDDYERFALSAGDRGTVEFTDSIGTIHVQWDAGRRVGITTEAANLIRKIGPSDKPSSRGERHAGRDASTESPLRAR